MGSPELLAAGVMQRGDEENTGYQEEDQGPGARPSALLCGRCLGHEAFLAGNKSRDWVEAFVIDNKSFSRISTEPIDNQTILRLGKSLLVRPRRRI